MLSLVLMTLQANSAPPDSEPRVIARKYRLESLLGEGGMGSVWRAFNQQLEVPVAIKLLRPDLSNVELGERLRVEARAAAKLVHPSIVRVFDIGEAESGDPFIVMEVMRAPSSVTPVSRLSHSLRTIGSWYSVTRSSKISSATCGSNTHIESAFAS